MDSSALMEILNGHCGMGWPACGKIVAAIMAGTTRTRPQAAVSHFQFFKRTEKVAWEDFLEGLNPSPESLSGRTIGWESFVDDIVGKRQIVDESNAGVV